ncbi:hypothetical protein NDU88_006204 [Pleurodeles waltl]|uniref:Uncharacterized protein n=1 Tax=Pleurodeles waltl TaxID=8319 RepID=A0AAV7RPL6_PLEWA|nr:hypothetical protein NDU88_006204 [Pleurodeles waltl]
MEGPHRRPPGRWRWGEWLTQEETMLRPEETGSMPLIPMWTESALESEALRAEEDYTLKGGQLKVKKELGERPFTLTDSTPVPDNNTLLSAIQASRGALEERMGEVHSEVSLLRQDLRKVAERVTSAESPISEMEDTVRDIRKAVSKTKVINKDVMWRLEDAENRAQRNNLRFVGFAEGLT